MLAVKKGADDGKIKLRVINYHVGTDFAADYFSYLFTEFDPKSLEFNMADGRIYSVPTSHPK
ncbi:MAG: hypothetical protein FWC19_04510 [Treponema sp.]|nr:hypothetical protein [Treponema sp.]MCL2272052.1 hypothetical protein [Treponema sp.]